MFNLKDPEGKYSPTAAATSPLEGDKDALYLAFQSGLIMRYQIGQSKMEPFFDITKEIKAMRNAAVSQGFKKGPFSHYRYPDDFTMLGDERGLLGLAFHPDKNRKGEFFIFYSAATDREKMKNSAFALDSYSILQRVTPVANKGAEEWIREELFSIPHPQWNHNGGTLMFGPHDGYLYIGLGDGGGFNDEHGRLAKVDLEPKGKRGVILLDAKDPTSFLGNAQDPTVPYGKILRIDVNQGLGFPSIIGQGYTIPKGNSILYQKLETLGDVSDYFQGPRVLPEIYTYGLRNPWKFDISQRGQIFVGDVGQSKEEKITVIKGPGENHGWRAKEGNLTFNDTLLTILQRGTDPPPKDIIVRPILTYGRNVGRAVIGGYLIDYGTKAWAEFDQRFPYYDPKMRVGYHQGRFYVFGDWTGKVMLGIEEVQDHGIEHWRWLKLYEFTDRDIHSFAKDKQGRIYVLHKTSVFAKTSEKTFGISRLQDLLTPLPTTTMKKSSLSFDIPSSEEEEEARVSTVNSRFARVIDPKRMHDFQENLEEEEIQRILKEVLSAAKDTESDLRRTIEGKPAAVKIHVTVLKLQDVYRELTDRNFVCPTYTAESKPTNDDDIPWLGAIRISRSKAFSGLAFSSNQNKITTDDLHQASQPGKGLWGIGHTNPDDGIITFGGGIPLYKNGKLVGGLGVSGDSSTLDHVIATEAIRKLGPMYQIPAHLTAATTTTTAIIPSPKTGLKMTKSMYRFPVFGLNPMVSDMLLLAENVVPIKYRRTPSGQRPKKHPDYLFSGSDKDFSLQEINFEYVVWHHIALTVEYVVASFLKNEEKKTALVKQLIEQFEQWGDAFDFFPSIYSVREETHVDMKSDKIVDPIKFWKELILTHTVAAKTIADNTWNAGETWEVEKYSQKLEGLLTILGENRTQIGKYLTALTKSTEAQKLWDAHLICTSDYISALHATQDHNGSAFGKAVFVCKFLGLELGGFLNKMAYGK